MARLWAAVHRDIRLDVTTIELSRLGEGDDGSLRRLIDDCIGESTGSRRPELAPNRPDAEP